MSGPDAAAAQEWIRAHRLRPEWVPSLLASVQLGLWSTNDADGWTKLFVG